ncbi:MAG: antibiotic biosynthesis monooxygenase [Coriobacteriales bacterium]|jgi:quinol monooxygenase YgiN|nr:antibiotic biosynthesis monooxygenase [Coriobacteriales bacterium]
MLKVVATMQIAPEVKGDVTPLIEKLVAATVQEEGCINYNFCKLTESAEAYAIIETWENAETLDVHGKSAHFTELIPQIAELVIGEIDIAVFEVLI